jgi:tripartite-type tricarboxylate transporter receptor subunit TctC
VIENRGGAGGNVGTEAAVKALPDGYTLLQVTIANAINNSLYEKLNFDIVGDIAPVASVYRQPLVLEVHAAVPVKTVPELIGYAKASPGKLNMVSRRGWNVSTPRGRIVQERMAGVEMVHVPYRGGAPALGGCHGPPED